MDIVIGIDIGGTNTKTGIINTKGEILSQKSLATQDYPELDDYFEKVFSNIEELTSVNDDFNILGIGIGAPNGNYFKGTIELAPNLPWKGSITFTESFRKKFGLPVFLTNDANAAAIGEMKFGGARNMKDFIMITLGTGLGSGLVVNGKLVYGHDGFAGELGHTTAIPNGRKCGCGRRGCLETYASAIGIKRTALELLSDRPNHSLLSGHTVDSISAKMIDEAAMQGDELALKAFDYTGKILGRSLADAVAYLSPQAIFLFGGLAQAGELIFKPTIKYFEKNLFKIYRKKVKILPSSLPQSDAALLGASALVLKELENNKA